jgi:hypothetical protein
MRLCTLDVNIHRTFRMSLIYPKIPQTFFLKAHNLNLQPLEIRIFKSSTSRPASGLAPPTACAKALAVAQAATRRSCRQLQTSNLELNEEWPIECLFNRRIPGPTPQSFNSYQLNTLSTKGHFYPDFGRVKKFSIKSDFLIFGPR